MVEPQLLTRRGQAGAARRDVAVAKRLGIFLCHRKGGVGVLALFIKLVVERPTRAEVFPDSDNLEDLALILGTARDPL